MELSPSPVRNIDAGGGLDRIVGQRGQSARKFDQIRVEIGILRIDSILV